MKPKIIDGRYLKKKDLKKRLYLMGIDESEHILNSKADYIEVYNTFIHKEAFTNKINHLLKNDHETYMTNKKSKKKKEITLSNEEDLSPTENPTPLTFGPKKKKSQQRKGTMERLDDELNLLLSKKRRAMRKISDGNSNKKGSKFSRRLNLTESRINLDSIYSIKEENIVLPKKKYSYTISKGGNIENDHIDYERIKNILKLSLSVFAFGSIFITGVYVYSNYSSKEAFSFIGEVVDSNLITSQLNSKQIVIIGLSILLVIYMINEYFNKKSLIDIAFDDYYEILGLIKKKNEMNMLNEVNFFDGVNVRDVVKAYSRKRKVSEEEYMSKYFFYMKEIIKSSDEICLISNENDKNDMNNMYIMTK